jgi:predicted kinase
MTNLFDFCPAGPDWRLPWDEMDREYPFVRALAGCPQDPAHHAEGDVWVHTRMVCQELVALPAWRALPDSDRRVVFAAAVLHDVAKPACTRTDTAGRLTSAGHSRRGAVAARTLLWRMAAPFADREQVAALVRRHQAPFFLIDRPDATRLAVEISQTARCDLLALLAEADARGRVSTDRQRLLDNVALFAEHARETGCWQSAYPFASDHARVLFFADARRRADAPAHEAFRAEVVLMSGLPGAGKDHHVRTCLAGWPVVSLDDLRDELGVSPAETQGSVVQEARDRARALLRQGRSFVWNATNLSRQLRGQALALFRGYNARLRIAYVEVPAATLLAQNHRRERRVPESVMGRMLGRWEAPDATEAHRVEYHVRG